MRKTVLVPVADGIEELEAVAIIDILRRAGAEVTVAAVTQRLDIVCSRGVKLTADTFLGDCKESDYDLVALPGGLPGAEHLRDSRELTAILERQRQKNALYAAICASPVVVLEHHGLLAGRQATCHPGFSEHLVDRQQAASRVVVDGNCITSQGPGTAVEFALTLVEQLFGTDRRTTVATPMVTT
ncbi:MAG: DJ-1 family protein [Desulfobulbus propionicus]|nr:MAG: DJ-1 family protein [Desulfobulbus propionicus]